MYAIFSDNHLTEHIVETKCEDELRWRKVRLQREDYCHKVTTALAKRFRTIVFEKLSIGYMVKNHKVARSIIDAT